jgi:hypothetical protein
VRKFDGITDLRSKEFGILILKLFNKEKYGLFDGRMEGYTKSSIFL